MAIGFIFGVNGICIALRSSKSPHRAAAPNRTLYFARMTSVAWPGTYVSP